MALVSVLDMLVLAPGAEDLVAWPSGEADIL